MKEIRKLKLEEKSIKEKKELILSFLYKYRKMDKDMDDNYDQYKETKEIFEMLSEEDPLLHEYIQKTFIDFEYMEERLDVPCYTLLNIHAGDNWDINNNDFYD